MGITRIADVTGLDIIGIPVVMVCRPNARSVSVSQGKGSTLIAARVSGLLESVEGYHAETISLPLRIASAHDMQISSQLITYEQLPRIRQSRFSKHYPISWIEGRNLFDQQGVWLPYEMVHTNYTYPRPTGSGCFPASSNGLASGNSLAEATVHAICEVIERDALALWQQLDPEAIDRTSIDPDSIDNRACRETLDRLRAANQDIFIWDIRSDTTIPSYLSVIIDKSTQGQHIGVGSGTHLSREIALLRALHEAVQVRTTYIVGARDDIRPDEYTVDGIAAKQQHFGRFIRRSTFSASFSRTCDLDSDSIDIDLQILMTALENAGITQIMQIDLTKPEFNIPVVRVVIPGMEAPHDDALYVPGERARKLRQACAR